MVEIKNIKKVFYENKNSILKKPKILVTALDTVSFFIKSGEILGVVGESGCGKTTLGRTIVGLEIPDSGEVIFNGVNILSKKIKHKRDRLKIQIIFQDPYASLDPRMTILSSLKIALLHHKIETKKSVENAVVNLLTEVGLSSNYLYRYPHELSGGERQRVAIARALSLSPELIIADEPVSALDVSVQAQILNLLIDLKKKHNLTMLFISHDLSVIRHIADRTAVMYKGKIVEIEESEKLFNTPKHPYTKELLLALPKINIT